MNHRKTRVAVGLPRTRTISVRGKSGVKVAVGLSGGVDSSMAAALLVEQGYEVTGVHLVCYEEPGCRAPQDRKDALAVALQLGIPFEVLDFQKEYKKKVIDHFYREYEAGRTPNPDVVCNREIKFGLFLKWAIKKRFDFIATGHYARVATRHALHGNSQTAYSADTKAGSFGGQAGHYARIGRGELRSVNGSSLVHQRLRSDADMKMTGKPGLQPGLGEQREFVDLPALRRNGVATYHLLRGVDAKKDQSYFLYTLTQKQLRNILFPIGHLTKQEVRKEARKRGLLTADKPDSVGICFVGDVDVQEFLRRRIKEKTGDVVDTDGDVIGKHKGVWFYTIGQRHGFSTSYQLQATSYQKHAIPPFYVVSKDVTRNRLIVGFGPETFVDNFQVTNLHFVNGIKDKNVAGMKELRVRIRHGGELIPSHPMIHHSTFMIHLAEPQRGVAPGQAAVFYRGEECLGGGVIAG